MKKTLIVALLLVSSLARAGEDDAIQSLTASRDSLTKQLNDRIAADAAKEAPLDVVLDLDEALVAYGYHLVRPPLTPAPQFNNDNAGKSMDRIHGGRMEFAPGREDARFSFQRRGGQWIGPEIGMISTRTRRKETP